LPYSFSARRAVNFNKTNSFHFKKKRGGKRTHHTLLDKLCRAAAKTHGAAQVGGGDLGHVDHEGVGRVLVDLGCVRIRNVEHVAGKLNHGDLETEADAQVGDFLGAGPVAGADLSLKPALAKAAGDDDASASKQVNN